MQRWLAGCTCQCVGSKLTCAYELQLFSPRGGRSSGLSKLTCAYELQPALLAGHSTDSLLETYLRIRIATSPCRCIKACILSSKLTCAYELQLLSEPSNSKDFSRNLPAHTNCNNDAAVIRQTMVGSKLTCAYELQLEVRPFRTLIR